MKKRFFLILISVIMLSLCACAASACFFSSGESSYKYPSSMNVTVNSERYDDNKGAFLFTYGENVEITKSDFTVTLNYSDGSSQTTDDYSLHTSFSSDEQPNVGTHWVYVTYTNGSKSLSESCKIQIEPTGYSVDLCDDFTVNYTGKDIDLLAAADAELKAEGKKTLSELTDEGIIRILWFKNPQYVKDVGEYEVRIVAIGNYTFENVYLNVTVKKAVIAAPAIKNDEIIYDGNAHTPEFEFAPGTEEFIEWKNTTSWTAQMTDKYTLAGTYTYVATPKDGIVEFEDGKTRVVLTMKILPAALTCLESDFKILNTEYVYKGESQCYTVDEIEFDIDTEIFSLSLSGLKVCDAGDYKLIATPKGSYLYADGTPITTLSFPFKIIPMIKDYSAQYDEIAQELIIKTTYVPDTKVSDFLDEHIKDNTKFILDVNKAVTGYSLGNSSLCVIESEDLLTAGTERYFIGYKPYSANYDYSPVPVTLVVEKAEMTAWCFFAAADNKPFVYDGNAHYYYASVTSGITTACTVDFLVYRNGELTESTVDAGNYKAKAEISLAPGYDKNYNLTIEGETEYEWQIDKKPFAVFEKDFNWTNTSTMFEPSENVYVGATLKNYTELVAIDSLTLLRNGKEVDCVLDCGSYEARASLRILNGNYELKTTYASRTWEVLSTEVDLSGLKWTYENGSVFTYGDNIKPALVNLPGYISVSYYDINGKNTSGVLNAGSYYIRVNCEINDIPNSDRAHIVKSPSALSFMVNKALLTESDFKCVYRIKYGQSYNNGNYGDYCDYDEEKKVMDGLSIDWYMFEVAGKEYVPECDVVYDIVSTNSQLIQALSTGIKHRGTGVATFTATLTIKSSLNYYFENDSLQVTYTVEVLR